MILKRLIFLVLAITSQYFNAAIFGQSKPVLSVPFVLNNDHIIIQIKLDDSEALNFLFDSGAGGTLITKFAADSLGMKPTVSRKNIGASGVHKVDMIKGVKLSIGEESIGNINILSTDTPLEEMDDGRKVHGVIGFPLLSKFTIEIDYSERHLKFYNRTSYTYTGNGAILPIAIDLTLTLPVTLATITMYNGTTFEGNFLVDTGARSELIMSAPSVVKYNMAENIGNHYTIRTDIGSSQRRTKIRYGRLKSLHFADYIFENIPVALSSHNEGVLSIPSLDGIIGNRLLQRFNVIFDYQRAFIYLEPSILIDDNYEINSAGFNIIFIEGKPYIKNLIDRSSADLAGIRNGDEIISINSTLVENITAKEIRNSFFKNGEKIAVVIKRKKKYKYTEFVLKALI